MEQKTPKDLEEAVKEFSYHMRSYGYRNSFTLSLPAKAAFTGNLNDCLNRYLAAHLEARAVTYLPFALRTQAPYNRSISCAFTIGFDTAAGFLIRGLQVYDSKSKTSRQFQLRSNRELPGSQTLEALFPKPKPWDFLRRGRFRP